MIWACDTCSFDLWIPVADNPLTMVGLYNDARFPGRCIVALKPHYDYMEDVPDYLITRFWMDAAKVGRAVKEVSGLERVNYSVLGNVVPHVHAHVIPRGGELDLNPGRPPWEDAGPKVKLPVAERDILVERLKDLL